MGKAARRPRRRRARRRPELAARGDGPRRDRPRPRGGPLPLSRYGAASSRSQSRTAAVPSSSVVHGFQPRWMRGPARVEGGACEVTRPRRTMQRRRRDAGGGRHRLVQLVDRRLTPVPMLMSRPPPFVGRPDERVDDVVDVDEVARLLAVAEDRARLVRRAGAPAKIATTPASPWGPGGGRRRWPARAT